MPSTSFSEADRHRIMDAVKKAEQQTTGEIRICIEDACPLDVLDRSAFIFKKLDIHRTRERNGVLIYLSLKDHKYAIIGDAGIHHHVRQSFWDQVGSEMVVLFREGKLADGIIHAVSRAGEKLSGFFPGRHDDSNELPDEIYFGGKKK